MLYMHNGIINSYQPVELCKFKIADPTSANKIAFTMRNKYIGIDATNQYTNVEYNSRECSLRKT